MAKPNETKTKQPDNELKDSLTEGVTDESSDSLKIEKLEHELIESERKSLGLFELTNDAIFLLDMNGDYIDVNQRAADMLGYNRHDIIGLNMSEFIVKEERESSFVKLKELAAGQILPIYQRSFQRRDGSKFISEINAAVVQDEEGNPEYIQSAVRDITERIEAQESLDKERRIYHALVEATIYTSDLADLCQRSIEIIAEVLEFDVGTFRTYDEKTRMLVLVAQVDFIKNEPGSKLINRSIDDENYVYALAAREKKVLITTRYEDRAILSPYLTQLNELGIYTLLAWPILDGQGILLGVLQLISYKHKEIDDKDLLFFETIAQMLTVAIERKRADEELKESEEKYRSFAQNFLGMAYRYLADWTPIFFHGAVEGITGYTEEELKNLTKWYDIMHPEDLAFYQEICDQLNNETNAVIDVEYRIIRKDGQIKWLHEIGQNICDENGKPQLIQGAIYDISERKRAEDIQAIQKELGIALSSQSNLVAALDYVLKEVCKMGVIDCGGAFIVDSKTGFLDLAACKGMPESYAKRISYYSTDSPFTQAILSGKSVYGTFSDVLTKSKDDDQYREEKLHALANIPIISDGRIVVLLSLSSHTSLQIPLSTQNALDTISSQIAGAITRMRVEDALRESNLRYRTFVQNFQGIAYRRMLNDTPEFLHGAVYDITGYTVDELISLKPVWKDIIHPYDLSNVKNATKLSITSPNKKGKFEYRIINKGGQIIWVQDIWHILTNDSNEVIGFEGSIHNITERRSAQIELQKLYLDLERRVEERTSQLTDANKELTAFSYSVSHDLRTPLRHIAGFTNLLEKRMSTVTEADERILSYTQKIIDSVEEMNKLIDGLLTFSRMSRVDMVKIQINFNELVHDVLNDFQVELGNRQVDVAIHSLPDVIGDPSLLRLVLVNLITNALKFTKTRNIAEINIGTMPSKEEGKATIYVRDNGVGFDMKYYDRLFGVFQRLHKNEEFEGTGIGLATVQRVIRRMGGMIWAEGEIDKGATFYFSISVAPEDDSSEN
ncbi:MAG: PAS domain S-box protein [Candidatus Heimdallarchaeota archaeon]